MHLIQLSIVFCLWAAVNCLNIDDVKETFECERIPLAKKQDPAWTSQFLKADQLYVPLLNKGELYKNTYHIVGPEEFAKMTEKDLLDACFTFKQNGTKFPGQGFGGRMINMVGFPHPLVTGIGFFAIPSEEKEPELVVTTYTTKTDNDKYVVGSSVWEDDYLKGAYVFSTKPVLDKSTMKEIKKHLVDLGYNPKLFVELNYDNCPPVSLNSLA